MFIRIIPTESNTEPDLDGKRIPTASVHIEATTTASFTKRMLVESVLVTMLLVVPFSVQAGVFSSLWSLFSEETMVVSPLVTETTGAQYVSLLSAARNADAIGGGDITVADGEALVSTGPVVKEQMSAARTQSGEISVYTVRPGDSLSQIADMYDVTSNTIMWANDLRSKTDIQPGDILVILPVAGVRHTISDGDTLASIVKKYDADTEEVLAYNNMTDDSSLAVGAELIIPGGMVTPPPVRAAVTPARRSGASAPASAAGWLAHPAPGAVRSQGLHGYNAVDLATSLGNPVRAAAAGEVIVARAAGYNGGYGNYVVIRHNNGAQTLYAHMNTLSVAMGSYVGQGQTIGTIGNTGRSTGPHLHFEVRGARNPF